MVDLFDLLMAEHAGEHCRNDCCLFISHFRDLKLEALYITVSFKAIFYQ